MNYIGRLIKPEEPAGAVIRIKIDAMSKRKIYFVFCIFLACCSASDWNRNNAVTVSLVRSYPGWKYLIMKSHNYCSDTVATFTDNDFQFICVDTFKHRYLIRDSSGLDVSKKVKMLGFSQIDSFNVMSFYLPTKEEADKIKNWDGGAATFEIEMYGIRRLDTILHEISGRELTWDR